LPANSEELFSVAGDMQNYKSQRGYKARSRNSSHETTNNAYACRQAGADSQCGALRWSWTSVVEAKPRWYQVKTFKAVPSEVLNLQ